MLTGESVPQMKVCVKHLLRCPLLQPRKVKNIQATVVVVNANESPCVNAHPGNLVCLLSTPYQWLMFSGKWETECLFCLAVSPAFEPELQCGHGIALLRIPPSLDSFGWVEVGGTSVKHFKTLHLPSFCASEWLKNDKVVLTEPPLLNSLCQGWTSPLKPEFPQEPGYKSQTEWHVRV